MNLASLRVVGGRHRTRRAPGAAPARDPYRSAWLRSLVERRLLHFIVAGGLVFALAPKPESRRDVAFDDGLFEALERAQAARLGAPTLTDAEAHDVRTRAVEDEILYREALRLGFDRSDNVVRQRLIQKVLFLAEDLAGVSRPPSDDELRAFFNSTGSQWIRPAEVRVIHVYAGPARRDWLAALRGQVVAAEVKAPGEPPPLGDAFPLARRLRATDSELERDYGGAFAAAVAGMAVGTWSEPVESKFGWHLVKVVERRTEGPASFEDVRGRLPITYLVARKKHAAADFLQRAFPRYRVTLDGEVMRALPTSGRVAPARAEEPD